MKLIIISLDFKDLFPHKLPKEINKMNVNKINTKRLVLLLSVVAIALVVVGCSVPGIKVKAPDTANQTSTTATDTGDAQFVQDADYFVTDELLGDNDWMYVEMAKLIAPATPETKGQAQFLMIQAGNTAWKKYWMKSRIAKSSDISLGKQVIVFEGNSSSDVYNVPASNQQARSYNWFISRIVDTSESFRGYVMVGGGYKVALNNLRVVVQ